MARSLVAAAAARHDLTVRRASASGCSNAARWEIYDGVVQTQETWIGDIVHFIPEGWEFQPATLFTEHPDPIQPANDFAGAVELAAAFTTRRRESR